MNVNIVVRITMRNLLRERALSIVLAGAISAVVSLSVLFLATSLHHDVRTVLERVQTSPAGGPS